MKFIDQLRKYKHDMRGGSVPQSVVPQGQFESLPRNMTPQQMAAKGNQNMARGYDSYGSPVNKGLPINPLQVMINMMKNRR